MLEFPALVSSPSIADRLNAPEALREQRLERSARMRFTVARALAQGRMRFDFQPVVRAAHRQIPAFSEMLARLTLPNGEVLPAGAFMPLVEEGPLGRAIDRLALSRGLETLADIPTLRLAINMSPISMGDEEYLSILCAWADRNPRAVARLILEVTETAAIRDIGTTVEFMNYAHGLGVCFALDDFGAGATGFRYFRDFRFDMVKIDGAYIQDIARTPDCQVLVECLLGVAKHFEMFTVAERVETEEEAEWLTRLGVDCLQGYLIGRPQAEPLVPQPVEFTRTAAG